MGQYKGLLFFVEDGVGDFNSVHILSVGSILDDPQICGRGGALSLLFLHHNKIYLLFHALSIRLIILLEEVLYM